MPGRVSGDRFRIGFGFATYLQANDFFRTKRVRLVSRASPTTTTIITSPFARTSLLARGEPSVRWKCVLRLPFH